MMLTAFLLPGLSVSGPLPALLTVAALAFINAQWWDAALFFQIPDSFAQPQLIVLGANAVIFWILVKILPGIEIRGILPAIAAPIIFTITSVLISKYEPLIDWNKVYTSSADFISSVRQTAANIKSENSLNSSSSSSTAPLSPVYGE